MLGESTPQALAFPSPAQLEAANRVLQEQVMERLRVETALQTLNDQLEIRVEERTTELKNANQQLRIEVAERKRAEAEIHKALEKEKELGELRFRFVSIASHEFRTPLATILSSTKLIEHYSHKLSKSLWIYTEAKLQWKAKLGLAQYL